MKKPRGCYEDMETEITTDTDGILDDCFECGAPGVFFSLLNGQYRAECGAMCGEVTDCYRSQSEATIAWNVAQRRAKLGNRFKGQACGEA